MRGIFLLYKDIFIFLLLIVYRISLDWIYKYTIAPYYDYMGFTLNIVEYKYLLSYVYVVLLYPFVHYLLKHPTTTSLFLIGFVVLYLVPGFSLYAVHGVDDYYILYCVVCFLILFILNRSCPTFIIALPSDKRAKQIFKWLILGIIGINTLIIGIYNGFRFHFSLTDVYDLRAIQGAMKVPRLVQYFQPLASSLVPISIVYFMIHRKYVIVFLLVVSQLWSFAFGGSKFTFFAIFIAFIAYFFYRQGRHVWLLMGAALLNGFVFIEASIFNGHSFIAIFLVRRIVFFTNLLGSQYYDFFSQHEFLYWRNSILRWLGFENPYPMEIPLLIGHTYYDRRMWANTGMFGEGFTHFGWLSVIIYPVLYIIAFRFFDACSRNLDTRIIIAAVILFVLTFIDGAFWGVMLTEGFMFTCLFLYFTPRKQW